MMKKLLIPMLALQLFFPVPGSADTGQMTNFLMSGTVLRVRESRGEVWMRSGPENDWEEVYDNMPVTDGYEIATEAGGFADIEVDSETFVRLGGETKIALTGASESRVAFEFSEGSVYVSRLSGKSDRAVVFSVGFSNLIVFSRQGAFRIDDTPRGAVTVAVREGRVRVHRFGRVHNIREKEMAWIGEEIRVSLAYHKDSWDDFNEKRDIGMLALSRRSRIDEIVPGRYDIDRYGEWLVVPAYGYVWRPRVVFSGWSPFMFGRWVFLSPFGWTWISLEPWGWITYHYGSWVTISNYGWVWVPSAQYRIWQPTRARIIFESRRVRWVPFRPGERVVSSHWRLIHRDDGLEINRGAIFSRPVFEKRKKGYAVRKYIPYNRRGHGKKMIRRLPAAEKRLRHDPTVEIIKYGVEPKKRMHSKRYDEKMRGKITVIKGKEHLGRGQRRVTGKVRREVRDPARNAKMLEKGRKSKWSEHLLPHSGKAGREREHHGIVKTKLKGTAERKARYGKEEREKTKATGRVRNDRSGTGMGGRPKR